MIWLALSAAGCTISLLLANVFTRSDVTVATSENTHMISASLPAANPYQPPTRQPGDPILTPTPEPPKVFPTERADLEKYVVQPDDTLEIIAQHFSVDVEALIQANQLVNPNVLDAGQVLMIPPTPPMPPGPEFKIIPDSELVNGPVSIGFTCEELVNLKYGYLSFYKETVEDALYSGTDVVMRVAEEYSVNPRILLAVLEYQSHWISSSQPPSETLDYPMRMYDPYLKGLYRQLSWAAAQLNYGYYAWRVNGVYRWIFPDGSSIPISTTINAGTAGVQHLMSKLFGKAEWQKAVTEDGVFRIYQEMFGYPFDFAYEPILPADLAQPTLQLPFETGEIWSFTGGPHAGWGTGSAWAALDFAPPGEPLGCVVSDAWVIAASDGKVVRSEKGVVVQDLDGDGFEQTGWTILYLHVDSKDRIISGLNIHAGDRIGHPSCEGGLSNGTHLHVARRYNGEWIPADGPLPFVMDGWISEGGGIEYDGYLRRGDQVIEAWDAFRPENQIGR